MAPLSLATSAVALLISAGSLFSLVSAATTTCVDNFSNGDFFQGFEIACGVDYFGGDLAATVTTSFEECIVTCKATEGCIDVSFVGGNDGGSCYMKSKISETPEIVGHVWTAKKMPITQATCVHNASDGLSFEGFEILCGVDYAGGDISGVNSASFEACILTCKTTATCVDVSFVGDNIVGGSCYMKSHIGATPDSVAHVWTAKKIIDTTVPQIEALTCEGQRSEGASYKTTNEKTFKVVCGQEYAGGDLSATTTDSFETCLDTCSTTVGCIDVSYVYGSCYMKSTLGELVAAGHVWTGVFVPSPSASASSTPSSTSSSPSTTATIPVGPLSCQDNKSNNREYGSATGGLYLIECGIDYAGGDLKATEATTFEQCISDCDATLGCVDVSYVAPSCYLKSELKEAVPVAHVWTAKVLKASRDIFAFPTATPRPLGFGTEEVFGGAYTYPAAPVATLGPSPPPGLNTAGLLVLTPDPVAQLWYAGAEGTDEGDVTVQLTITYAYPSIVLEHSSHIGDIACGTGITTIGGRFDDETSYFHASSQWSPNEPTILITNKAGCSSDGQNIFFLAQSISFDALAKTFSATGAVVELKDIFTTMDADFGQVPAETTPTTSASCGAPTGPVLNGLPAIACGEFFDTALDSTLGFYSTELTSGEAVLAAAAPNLAIKRRSSRHVHSRRGHSHHHGYNVHERGLSIRHLQKRCNFWDVSCLAKEAADAARRAWEWTQEQARKAWELAQRVARELAEAIEAEARRIAAAIAAEVARIARLAAEAAERLANQIIAAAKAIADAVAAAAQAAADLLLRGKYSRTLNLPFHMGPPEAFLTESPWGPAMKLYTFKRGEEDEAFSLEKQTIDGMWDELIGVEADPEPGVEVYCHKCAIEGRIIATGSITATLLSGVTKGQIGVRGNLYAGAFIGVNAFAQWEKTVKEPLLVRNLAGWKIPGIINLGPQLILEAMATVSIEATGQLYTGVSLTWPAFEANLDFIDSSKSTKSGWTPEVEQAFEVNGKVEAKAALGLPVTLNFGIDILDGLWQKGINLTDTPAITASAEFSIEYEAGGDVVVGNDECQGVSWEIALTNEVRLDIDEIGGWTLAEWASPALASGCVGRAIEGGGDEDPENPEDVPTTTLPTAVTTSTSTPTPTVVVLPPASSDTTVGGSIRCPAEIVIPYQAPYCSFSSSGPFASLCAIQRAGIVAVVTADAQKQGLTFEELWATQRGYLPQYKAALAARAALQYYVDDFGEKYETKCNINYAGADISILVTQSWTACVEECSAWGNDCAGISWIPSRPTQNCYIKSAMTTGTPDTDLGYSVWSSVKIIRSSKNRRTIETLPLPGLHKRDYASARAALLSNLTLFSNSSDSTNTTLSPTLLPTNSTNAVGTPPFSNSTAASLNTTVAITSNFPNTNLPLSLNSTTPLSLNTTIPLASNTTLPPLNNTAARSIRITDTTNTLLLNPSTTGNLFISVLADTTPLGPGSSTSDLSFVASASTSTPSTLSIWGDSYGRFLHYYPSTMASHGVSRLRLANWEYLPLTAKLISLVPFTTPSGEKMLVGVDTDGSYAWLFVCGIKGEVNKVFLVKDVDSAAEALGRAEMKFTVTGGQASGCVPLALVVEG